MASYLERSLKDIDLVRFENFYVSSGRPILLFSCHGAAQNLAAQHKLVITVPLYDVEAIHHTVLKV
jgi:hypothetical protein